MVQTDGDGKKRIILKVTFTAKVPSLTLSYDAAVVFAGESKRIGLGPLWIISRKGQTMSPDQLEVSIDRLDPSIREADIILTPNPAHVEQFADVPEIWGKGVVLRGVPLERLDLIGRGVINTSNAPLTPVEAAQGSSTSGSEQTGPAAKPVQGTGSSAASADRTLAEQPPVVVETFPLSGTRDTAPGKTQIRVRFSKPMTDSSWSWSTAWKDSAPEFIGQPHYEADRRTCVVNARLEGGRTYAFWLNSEKFQNFKDGDGRPAVPYLLIFQTKPK